MTLLKCRFDQDSVLPGIQGPLWYILKIPFFSNYTIYLSHTFCTNYNLWTPNISIYFMPTCTFYREWKRKGKVTHLSLNKDLLFISAVFLHFLRYLHYETFPDISTLSRKELFTTSSIQLLNLHIFLLSYCMNLLPCYSYTTHRDLKKILVHCQVFVPNSW